MIRTPPPSRWILFFVVSFILNSGGTAFMTSCSKAESISACPTKKKRKSDGITTSGNMSPSNKGNEAPVAGKLEELKLREAELSRMLEEVRQEKLSALRSRPLVIGLIGFGRFGQFIARTFQKYGRVIVTSRSDYTEIANGMGVSYIPLDDLDLFLAQELDVIVVATSILSFESTIASLVPPIRRYLDNKLQNGIKPRGPLIVDVLSVKEHARQIMLDLLPMECDVLCTHPMFGPDSGKHSWQGLNFVYEKTRIDGVILDPPGKSSSQQVTDDESDITESSDALVEGMDRIERFLSIWEEEGCRMLAMSCKEHDSYAANSQFITHLMGRILGEQGLANTPIDTKGFESVLQLISTTTADSFDLFYGLYKFNQNSMNTIVKLREAMDNVVDELNKMEKEGS
jgi:arogenate dehydrogenase (NADP+), plant